MKRRIITETTKIIRKETPYGYGIFAKVTFKKGQTVGEIKGDVMNGKKFESDYCMDLGHNRVLEPQNIFRHINHNCHPNCELFTYDEADDHRLFVEALRDIQPGEQITIDYAWNHEHAIPCLCESSQCRGWIVDESELELVK